MPQKGSESHHKWGLTHSPSIGLTQTCFVAVSTNILTNLMTKEKDCFIGIFVVMNMSFVLKKSSKQTL